MKLVKAYSVNTNDKQEEQYDRVVAIVYRDNFDKCREMFIKTFTHSDVHTLVTLINEASQSEDLIEKMN